MATVLDVDLATVLQLLLLDVTLTSVLEVDTEDDEGVDDDVVSAAAVEDVVRTAVLVELVEELSPAIVDDELDELTDN